MIAELNLTKYLKAAYRRRPPAERAESFKEWMKATAYHHTTTAQFQVNGAAAAAQWCARKGMSII